MLQKIEVSLQQLVERPSISAERLQWATSLVNLFFGSFRKADADDPETFTAGCLRLFTAYPPEVVHYIVDPVTGLPGQSEWLPSLKKVKDALDERAGYVGRIKQREEREREQLDARRADEGKRAIKPSYQDLKSQYGENWGLQTPTAENEEVKAKRLATMQKANRSAFEAECESAGWTLDSTISPSLRALLKAGLG